MYVLKLILLFSKKMHKLNKKKSGCSYWTNYDVVEMFVLVHPASLCET